jgi:hypothetical protein
MASRHWEEISYLSICRMGQPKYDFGMRGGPDGRRRRFYETSVQMFSSTARQNFGSCERRWLACQQLTWHRLTTSNWHDIGIRTCRHMSFCWKHHHVVLEPFRLRRRRRASYTGGSLRKCLRSSTQRSLLIIFWGFLLRSDGVTRKLAFSSTVPVPVNFSADVRSSCCWMQMRRSFGVSART